MSPLSRETVFIGFSQNELTATIIGELSIRLQTDSSRVHLRRISRQLLGPQTYRRATREYDGQLWDVISDAPMSTDHAIARFFIPWLMDFKGWALFTDGDILCRRDIREVFAAKDSRYGVQCVQHAPLPTTGHKKDGAIQTAYPRKNWSSVMLFNCEHESHQRLTPDLILNQWPGRDLHAFKWLADSEIGPLDPAWNYLSGIEPRQSNPAIVHFTTGVPTTAGHENDPFAHEWFAMARQAGYDFESYISTTASA